MRRKVAVLQVIQPGEQVRADDIMARLGVSRSAAGQALDRLWYSQQLERVSRGVFRLAADAPPLSGHMKVGRPSRGVEPFLYFRSTEVAS